MERQKIPIEESKLYIEHFRDLSRQAAILNVEAYTTSGRSQDIVRAWLLEDKTGLDRLTWKDASAEEISGRALSDALFLVAQELWNDERITGENEGNQRHLTIVPETALQ